MQTIRRKREMMEERRRAAEAAVAREEAEAQRHAQAGSRALAGAALGRRNTRRRELAQVQRLIDVTDGQLAAIEQASLSASMADSMADSAAVMTSVHRRLDPARVERDMVTMRTQAREAEYVTRLMSKPLSVPANGLDADDDADTDEQRAINDELDSIMATSSLTAAAPSVPTTPPHHDVPAQPLPPQTAPQNNRQPLDLKSLEAQLGL